MNACPTFKDCREILAEISARTKICSEHNLRVKIFRQLDLGITVRFQISADLRSQISVSQVSGSQGD